MKKVLCTILLALVINSANGTVHNFNNVQLDNLHYAYSFGEQFAKNGKYKNVNNIDKQGLGYIMAAIAWQESSAGCIKTPNKKEHNAYGMFQNYVPTVKNRAKQIGWELNDSEIKRMLNNRNNSAVWAYVELSYWINIHNGNIQKAISSYNAGWNIKAGNKYASDVLAKAEYLKNNDVINTRVD